MSVFSRKIIFHTTVGITLSGLLLIACKPDAAPVIANNSQEANTQINQELSNSSSSGMEETKHEIVGEVKADSSNQIKKIAKEKKPVNKESNKAKKIIQKPRAPRPKPQIEFEVIRHDFGTIIQGDTVLYNFNFVNKGKAPLEIESAKATCGCTQPSFPFIPIEPGEEGYIGVMYISVGKEGHQEPTITVTSNATKEPITLLMTGTVEVPKDDEIVADPLDSTAVSQDTIGQN